MSESITIYLLTNTGEAQVIKYEDESVDVAIAKFLALEYYSVPRFLSEIMLRVNDKELLYDSEHTYELSFAIPSFYLNKLQEKFKIDPSKIIFSFALKYRGKDEEIENYYFVVK